MFCSFCGKEVDNNANYCNNCGNKLNNSNQPIRQSYSNTKNSLCHTGFILSIIGCFFNLLGLISLAGLILSILGLSQVNKTNEDGKGFAIAGIVVSSIYLLGTLILLSVLMFVMV